MLQLVALQDGEIYSIGELVHWIESRSRLCSTHEWSRVLSGKCAFEVGEFTYYLKRKKAEQYLVSRVRTIDLIEATENLNGVAGRLVCIGRVIGVAVVLSAASLVGGLVYLCVA